MQLLLLLFWDWINLKYFKHSFTLEKSTLTSVITNKNFCLIFPIFLPLFALQSLSIPFRFKANRESSVKLSTILKSHSGLTSNRFMWFLAAYCSAWLWLTCLLKAKWSRFPINTFGTPGACCKKYERLATPFSFYAFAVI